MGDYGWSMNSDTSQGIVACRIFALLVQIIIFIKIKNKKFYYLQLL